MKNTSLNQKRKTRHVFIIGAKSIGFYGGFESFVMHLLDQHQDNNMIRYHVACKENGQGHMILDNVADITHVNNDDFIYKNAECHLIKIPEYLGPAQALIYDLKALRWVCNQIETKHLNNSVLYVLGTRIGPFVKSYYKRLRNYGTIVFQNPDGLEHKRRKWPLLVRCYWKLSEKYAIKNADKIICDSKSIEKYINKEYHRYKPDTIFIPYGTDTKHAMLSDDDARYVYWLKKHKLHNADYILSVGRLVKENNVDIMIREFMHSSIDMNYVIISTRDNRFVKEIQKRYNFRADPRIKFVGSVYDMELLDKIRENAYAYIHGHEVGGTNPSLLESLGKTNINLLFDVSFNREVAGDSALYWTKEKGNLAGLLEEITGHDYSSLGDRAKERMRRYYSWEKIADDYEDIFTNTL